MKITKEEKIDRSLSYSIKDGAAASVSQGVGESFIAPYAIALQATNAEIAALTSIPNLIAPLSQLATPKLMEKIPRKKILLMGILLQALMWVPIMLLSLIFLKDLKFAPLLLIIFFTIYTLCGSFIAPAWTSWMKDLTEKRERGAYFSFRNRIAGSVALLATLAAGFFLDFWKNSSIFIGFGILFFIALISRLISRHFISKKYESKFKIRKGYYFTFFDFIKKAPQRNFGKFALYVALINLATNISGPFFAVYMLRDLHFNYLIFTIINLSSSLVTLLTLKAWGHLSDRFGNIKILTICGFLVPFVPILWLFSASPYWLIGIQIFGGLAWAGWNLAASNFVYDAVTKERVALCAAYVNILSGLGIFIGATIGGLLATYIHLDMNVLLFIFIVSGIARFAVSLFMLPKIKEVRLVEKFKAKEIWKFIPITNPEFLVREIREILLPLWHLDHKIENEAKDEKDGKNHKKVKKYFQKK